MPRVAALPLLSCLHPTSFPSTVTCSRPLLTDERMFVTTPALVAAASCVVAALVVVVVRRAAVRFRSTSDVGSFSVSRQWLIQHQSNDRT